MNNCVEYKGYYGKVEYSSEDEVFFGTIFGINDLVTFEGESVKSLKEDFIASVESYLELCENLGKEPEKSFKGQFNVRISPDLHRRAAFSANSKGISLNSFVESAIENYLDGCYHKLAELENTLKIMNTDNWFNTKVRDLVNNLYSKRDMKFEYMNNYSKHAHYLDYKHMFKDYDTTDVVKNHFKENSKNYFALITDNFKKGEQTL